MPAFNEPTNPQDIPPPTADRALLSAFVEAYISTRPKAEALELLRHTASVLADRDTKSTVVIRLRKADREAAEAEAEANRQAIALFRQMLPGCVSRLLPDGEDID